MPADMNDYFKKRKPSGENNNNGGNFGGGGFNMPQMGPPSKSIQWLVIAGIVVVLLVLLKPFTIINSGEVGIKVRTGKFSPEPLMPGLSFYIPIIETVIPVNIRTRLMVYSNTERDTVGDDYTRGTISGERFEGGVKKNPSIEVLDRRGLTVNIDIAVQYRLREEVVPTTIAEWGSAWEEKIINTRVREVVRDVVGQYTAEQLPEMRNDIANAISKRVKETVESLRGKPVWLESVELRNIGLPQRIREQIERVQVERQEITIAELQKERATEEALKRIEEARGVAEKNRIEAQGQADANKLVGESLTRQLLELRQIDTQMKFNEALKENKDAQIFLTPGGSVPNIWVDSKNKQQNAVVGQ